MDDVAEGRCGCTGDAGMTERRAMADKVPGQLGSFSDLGPALCDGGRRHPLKRNSKIPVFMIGFSGNARICD